MNKYKIISLTVIMGLFLTLSCTEGWEEMNEDPNNPNEVPATNILAHTLRVTGDAFYDDWQGMNNFLSYSGLVSKIQYIDEALYDYRESVVNTAWTDYYTLLQDQEKMKEIALEQGRNKTWAVAETFSVFLTQMLTDQWKDVPYSKALSGEEGEGNYKVSYDAQQSIYMNMITRLENANEEFNKPVNAANPDALGEGDKLYGGDFDLWQKFCNSLRLKIALRISEIDEPTAQTLAETILTNPADNPIFESNADNAFLYWPGTAPYKEPWAENLETRDDHGMAKTLVDTLYDIASPYDPRLPVYAIPVTGASRAYVGVVEGAEKGSFATDTISRIGEHYRNDPDGYTPFMRYSEVMFNVAEAALNGWNTGAYTAQAAYEEGISASFAENGVSADYASYLTEPGVAWTGTTADDRHRIYKQKWIALFKQGQEAWALQRRTDFPPIDVSPGAVESMTSNHNRQPFRYPYPSDEKTLNKENYEAAAQGIEHHFWGQKMWWDTRSDVIAY